MRQLAALLLLTVAAAAQDALRDAVARAELGRFERAPESDPLERAAAAPEAATRRAAARAAGRLRRADSISWLVPLLDDEAGPVRRAALFALGQIGGAEVVVPLRSALGRLPADDLPRAVEALGKSGDRRAAAAARRLLRHKLGHVREAAALALFRLEDTSALPDLFSALHVETEPEARWKLVYAAYRLLRARSGPDRALVTAGDVSWARLLKRSLATGRPYAERVFATLALGRLSAEREAIVALLDDADERVVVAALRSLARPWEAAVARKCLPFLDARHDVLVREAAVGVLLAGEKAAEPLVAEAWKSVADPDHPWLFLPVQVASAKAGQAIADLAPDLVGEAWDEEVRWKTKSHLAGKLPAALPATRRGRAAAAEVLGEEHVPAEAALPFLRELARDRDFVVSAVAIGSLAKRGDEEAVATIVAAAKGAPSTRDMDVRIEAAGALEKLGVHDAWLDRAAAEDPDRPVRAAARKALAALGRPLPPVKPAAGFRLHGHDAAGVLGAARALAGARVTLETTRGRITMVLYPDEAPAHCVNLATLVRQGFYDGLTWHRVVADFVIQGGCPRGDGWGGPGYLLPDEIGTRPYVRGTVGMPKAGDDTGGCQIFITHLPTPHLDGRYTVFAQVIEGLAVIDEIRVGDRILRATLAIAGEK